LALSLVVSAVIGLSAFEAINPITIMQRGVIFGFGAGVSIIVAIFLF